MKLTFEEWLAKVQEIHKRLQEEIAAKETDAAWEDASQAVQDIRDAARADASQAVQDIRDAAWQSARAVSRKKPLH